MKASAYYGIQFAQSRYLLLWQCNRQKSIVEDVFDPSEEISVQYDVLVSGRENVQRYFEIAERDQIANGGFIRNDAASSQFITILADGQEAIGNWTTLTGIIEVPQYGNVSEAKTLRYCLGRFNNKFKLNEGIWRLATLHWEPIIEIEGWKLAKDQSLEKYCQEPKNWLEIPSRLQPISDDGVSHKTAESLLIRNTVMSFCHHFNCFGISSINPEWFSKAAMQSVMEMLKPLSGCKSGIVLATSPIVTVEDNLSQARLFMSVTHLKRLDDSKIEHQRGSVSIELIKSESEPSWKIDKFDWYRYATLDPWTITG